MTEIRIGKLLFIGNKVELPCFILIVLFIFCFFLYFIVIVGSAENISKRFFNYNKFTKLPDLGME